MLVVVAVVGGIYRSYVGKYAYVAPTLRIYRPRYLRLRYTLCIYGP